MGDGKGNGGSRRPQDDGGRDDGGVPRRRGRPSRPVSVAVSYRPRSEGEDNKEFNDAVRMLIASMVRERMATTREVET